MTYAFMLSCAYSCMCMRVEHMYMYVIPTQALTSLIHFGHDPIREMLTTYLAVRRGKNLESPPRYFMEI
jgi:hypothetical protein